MKRMWCSDGGVSEVQVRDENGVTLACEAADECWWEAQPGTLHETEAAAMRAWLRAEEARAEEAWEREMREVEALRAEEARVARDLRAAFNSRDNARDALATVRAQLAELDAVEGGGDKR